MEKSDPNSILKKIEEYFSGEMKIEGQENVDISYKNWINEDDNLKKLCKIIKLKNPQSEANMIIKNHDHDCELKLLKWITEDQSHKDKFVKLPKTQIKLNRDSNILPYEFNAVTIDGQNYNGEINYINASFINGPMFSDEFRNMFLVTQAPLPDTVFEFWATVKTYQIPLILMLANVLEEGRTKSEVYWPNELNKEKIVTNGEFSISIVCTSLTEAKNENFIRRKFVIDNCMEVEQIQILNWPDHSIPNLNDSDGNFDTIQFSIDTINAYLISKRLPVLIHCSAGVGRTGTFISIFNIS